MGSSRTRARTLVPCVGRRILNHCATREAPYPFLKWWYSSYLCPKPTFFSHPICFFKRYSHLCPCFQSPSICCWLPNLYLQFISFFWVSNLKSQLPTKIMCPKGKACSTCPVMNPSNFLSKCIPLCFHHPFRNPARTLMFQRIVLFTWWLASKRRKQKLSGQLRVISVTGAS